MLSPGVRGRDKDSVNPNRIPKLFLTDEMAEEARRRGLNVGYLKGRAYVVITDFESTRWIKFEARKATRNSLSYALVRYCSFLKAFPDDLIEIYKRDRDRLMQDIRMYLSHMVNSGYSNNYINNSISGVISWLNANGILISRSELRVRRIRIPPKTGFIQDMPPTRDELRRILMNSPLKWRAVFHFLSATGMRPSEALVLRLSDVKPHPFDAADAEEVMEVNVPDTLTKKDFSYTTFCHPEAVKSLAEYLKQLEQRGVDIYDEKLPLFYNPRRKFFRLNSVEVAWNRILEKLNLDERIVYVKKRVHVRRLYTLRKFFRTNLETAGIPHGAVEAMLGHKQWYVRFTRKQLRKYYEKGMWALMVFRTVTEERIKEILEAELGKIRSEIEALKMEREKYLINKEREVRDLVEKLYRILRRHPEILKELEET